MQTSTAPPTTKVAETRGRRRFEGRKQLSDFFADSEKLVRFSPKHVTVNSIVRVSDDEATAESIIVLFIDAGGVPELVSTGRYMDKLRRCADGRWRFYERIGHQDTLKPPPTA
jgi:SnoaL-like domain